MSKVRRTGYPHYSKHTLLAGKHTGDGVLAHLASAGTLFLVIDYVAEEGGIMKWTRIVFAQSQEKASQYTGSQISAENKQFEENVVHNAEASKDFIVP